MHKNAHKNAQKAILITSTVTMLIAGAEIVNALGYYKPGMNLLDFASYVQANPWIFGLTFIIVNLAMLPAAVSLYKGNKIDLKKEIYEKKTLAGDILWGLLLMALAAIADLAFLWTVSGQTDLALESIDMSWGVAVLYFISLVLVSGICKEIYFRGFAKHFVSPVLGEIGAFLLLNVMFGLLDWYNMGYSFVLGLICILGYKKRKHLITPMIIHGGVNLIGIIYLLATQLG